MLRWLYRQAFGVNPSAGQVWVAIVAGLFGMGLAASSMYHTGYAMMNWQWALLLLIAFDLSGGVAALATDAAHHHHHRADQPMRPALFALAHVHPLVAAAFLPGMPVYAALLLWVCTGMLAMLVPLADDRLRRPLSLVFSASFLALVTLVLPAQWLWLAPAYVLKLIAAQALGSDDHLLRGVDQTGKEL